MYNSRCNCGCANTCNRCNAERIMVNSGCGCNMNRNRCGCANTYRPGCGSTRSGCNRSCVRTCPTFEDRCRSNYRQCMNSCRMCEQAMNYNNCNSNCNCRSCNLDRD